MIGSRPSENKPSGGWVADLFCAALALPREGQRKSPQCHTAFTVYLLCVAVPSLPRRCVFFFIFFSQLRAAKRRPSFFTGHKSRLRATAQALCSPCRAGGWIETPHCQFDNHRRCREARPWGRRQSRRLAPGGFAVFANANPIFARRKLQNVMAVTDVLACSGNLNTPKER